MKNTNGHPVKRQDTDKTNVANGIGPAKKSADTDNKKPGNYKYGEDNSEGPNWDKVIKGGDGDTGQNAGIFK